MFSARKQWDTLDTFQNDRGTTVDCVGARVNRIHTHIKWNAIISSGTSARMNTYNKVYRVCMVCSVQSLFRLFFILHKYSAAHNLSCSSMPSSVLECTSQSPEGNRARAIPFSLPSCSCCSIHVLRLRSHSLHIHRLVPALWFASITSVGCSVIIYFVRSSTVVPSRFSTATAVQCSR